MDIATIIGLIMGTVLILWSMFSGGTPGWFLNYHAMGIVFGGAMATVFISFPMKSVKRLVKVFGVTFKSHEIDPAKVIADMVAYAEIARRDGILSLENKSKEIDDEFVVRGIQMAVDGIDPEVIEQIMDSELESLKGRHAHNKAMLDAMTNYAPALGMVGTLIGLVIMLKSLDNPKAIGPGMATAILATLYGAVVANLVIGPMANKLAKRTEEEMLLKSIIIRGVMSIQSGDNPRIVEQKLKTFLPPALRKATERKEEKAA